MPLEQLMDRFSEEDDADEEQSADEDTPQFGEEATQHSDTLGTDNGDGTTSPAPDGGAAAQSGGTDYRVDELEDHVEQNAEALENVERSQEEIAESVEEMNDTVRQLLGMYSQVTAADNPFVEDDGEGFGVVEDLPEEASEAEAETDPEPESEPEPEPTADPTGDSETVSFDDLAATQEEYAESAERTSERGNAFAEAAAESPEGIETIPADRTEPRDSLLPALPEGYAAEVVVFEWLSMLVTSTGPAAALKALAYYEEVGWISGQVREHLDMALSGPDLDIHVDPNSPKELTASDHAESYAYIKQLRELEQMEVSFAE